MMIATKTRPLQAELKQEMCMFACVVAVALMLCGDSDDNYEAVDSDGGSSNASSDSG